MSVLVVGAGGFVGKALVAELRENGHRVTGTSRSGDGDLEKLDLCRPGEIESVLTRFQPTTVVSLAGPASVAASWRHPEHAFEGNTAATASLLEAIPTITPEAHLVLASSAAVYGRPASPRARPFAESDPLRPASPYAASKAAAEVLVGERRRRSGLKASVLRLFNQIGPGQPDSQAPSEFARRIAEAEILGSAPARIEIGNPLAARDYTDVRDSARAMRLIIEEELTGTLNLCSGRAVSLGEIASGLAEQTGVEVVLGEKAARAHPQDIDLVSGDSSKLVRKTGWATGIPLEQSLGDLLEFWRAVLAER